MASAWLLIFTLQPLLVHQEFLLSSLMLATGPRDQNSAPCSPCLSPNLPTP